jgi:hypothetical protein
MQWKMALGVAALIVAPVIGSVPMASATGIGDPVAQAAMEVILVNATGTIVDIDRLQPSIGRITIQLVDGGVQTFAVGHTTSVRYGAFDEPRSGLDDLHAGMRVHVSATRLPGGPPVAQIIAILIG